MIENFTDIHFTVYRWKSSHLARMEILNYDCSNKLTRQYHDWFCILTFALQKKSDFFLIMDFQSYQSKRERFIVCFTAIRRSTWRQKTDTVNKFWTHLPTWWQKKGSQSNRQIWTDFGHITARRLVAIPKKWWTFLENKKERKKYINITAIHYLPQSFTYRCLNFVNFCLFSYSSS